MTRDVDARDKRGHDEAYVLGVIPAKAGIQF
jgi:hypothetical protein